MPSVVVHIGSETIVGEGAKDRRAFLNERGLEREKNIFWNCKNYMGVRRTYHKAQDGFRSAKEISGQILKFLVDAVPMDKQTTLTRTVISVPASYQSAQRDDTVQAAELAEIDLKDDGLIDEPIAAFLSFLYFNRGEIFTELDQSKRLVVFDFGGGTCDVAIFELFPQSRKLNLKVAPLMVSRYHRLGGGDIDRAIVVDVLLPQLYKQNNVSDGEFDFGVKSKFIIPALLGVAEELKIGLCREINRLKNLGQYESKRSDLAKKIPGFFKIDLRSKKNLKLTEPTLSACEFERVLEPFLESELLYYREMSEYYTICSIFAPLEDALERANLRARDIDLCLLVGGSSLVPQVFEAVEKYFFAAEILRFDKLEEIQTSVAQGAALQALSQILNGKSVISPITNDCIRIQTESGPIELIPKGEELPYFSNENWAVNKDLQVPNTGKNVELNIEINNSHDEILMQYLWRIERRVTKGDALRLYFRMDSNQVLHLKLELVDDPTFQIARSIENPLTNIVNPNKTRNKILDLEEQIRTQSMTSAQRRLKVLEVAKLEAELSRFEKALYFLRALNKQKPESHILHRMGLICGEMRDFEREEKFYLEAARISSNGSASLFNLALSKKSQGKFEEAIDIIDEAIKIEQDPAYLILKVLLSDHLNLSSDKRNKLLQTAIEISEPLHLMSDFDIYWYERGNQLAGNSERLNEVEDEKRRRKRASIPKSGGELPKKRSENSKN